ncbi:DUF2938 family protein [Flavobacterium sp. XGLA_31]|uniref:DUF2938 family protein n=1 Tax=Flavobacterium sp. XGLA_31 TaxID=3447666 RepID=UPI003F33F8AF
MNNTLKTILVGIGATAAVDVFTYILSLFTHKGHGILYIGRWEAYIFKGQFVHNTIRETPSMANELLIGWITHYTIGVVFAFSLVFLFGKKWLNSPSFLPAMILGNVTLFIPICIVQPVLGFGIAFSKIPQAPFLLIKIILIHTVYSIGIYWMAMALKHLEKSKQKNSIAKY